MTGRNSSFWAAVVFPFMAGTVVLNAADTRGTAIGNLPVIALAGNDAEQIGQPAAAVAPAAGAAEAIAPAVTPAEEGTIPVPPPSVKTAAPKSTFVQQVDGEEQLRRQAMEEHGLQSLDDAKQSMLDKDYQKAIRMYEEALNHIGDRPETSAMRREALVGLPEARFRWAEVLYKRNDLDGAEKEARQAMALNNHPKALKLVGQIEEDRKAPTPPPPAKPHRWREEDFKKTETEIDELMKKGHEHFMVGEYADAQEMFERVLKRDPENSEAIRMREKIGWKRFDRANAELNSTRADMVYQVRDTWNPRSYGLMEQASDIRQITQNPSIKDMEEAKQRQKVLEKMDKIKIPEVDFRQANIYDVIQFLAENSVEFDRVTNPEAEKRGVDIVLDLGSGAATASPKPAGEVDPFQEDLNAANKGGAASGVPLITFKARYISVLEVLKIVTKLAKLKYSVRESLVMVVPLDAPVGDIQVRTYDVLPNVKDRLTSLGQAFKRSGDGRAEDAGFTSIGTDVSLGSSEEVDWKTVFEEMGVEWPRGSKIRHIESIGKIVVANTLDNLEIFEQVLKEINVVPSQIEIEARFVEVQQSDLDALGFQWMLTDDWEMLEKKGQESLPPAARQRIVASGNSALNGFTKGLRFAETLDPTSAITLADDVLHVGSVLTNPELAMVLHALQQRKNTDLLSAPKVTTQSGNEATIKVVTEYIYPTEFTVEPILGYSGGGGGNYGGTSQPVGAVVEPGGFETREVGVILTCLPEVSTEGQMISLTLAPEVVSEPTWRNYGSSYQTYQVDQATVDPAAVQNQLPMEQPFFHVRSVQTQINIYNGATVMMGGMITENRTSIDDKIPFLGDIPIIGRLFRSHSDKSEKKNLLIFVTARLVDPAGRPVIPKDLGGTIEKRIADTVQPTAAENRAP